MRDVGKRRADIAVGSDRVRSTCDSSISTKPPIEAPLVGDLAGRAEVDAVHPVGGAGDRRVALPLTVRLACIGLCRSGTERAGHEQAAVEQLPLGSDLDRLVLFRRQAWMSLAIRSARPPYVRAGARPVRRRPGSTTSHRPHRGWRKAAASPRRRHCSSTCRSDADAASRRIVGRADVVVVEAHAAVEDDEIVVVGGLDE